jgi:hypothetical protein
MAVSEVCTVSEVLCSVSDRHLLNPAMILSVATTSGQDHEAWCGGSGQDHETRCGGEGGKIKSLKPLDYRGLIAGDHEL